MKILRVAQKLYPEHPGGGTYHVHAMSRDQAAMGHDVTVLTVSENNSLPRREERDGYKVVRYKPTADILGNEISVGVAHFLKDANDYDVIHAHSHLYFLTNVAALKRRLDGIPLAITNHGLYSQNAPEWLFNGYLRTIGRWTFNSADSIFCYTGVEEDRLRELGVKCPIEVVHNGIDTKQFKPNGPIYSEIETDVPVVLFVGRLVEGKRPDHALESFDELHKNWTAAKLYFCGNGPLRNDLENSAHSKGLSENVEFLDHVPYDKMPSVYRAADVLVLPSRAEGFPRTVIEALATGTPVVCSDLAQISAEIGDIVQTVPEGDISRYVEEMDRALQNQTGVSRIERVQKVNKRYSWESTVDLTTEILREMIDND